MNPPSQANSGGRRHNPRLWLLCIVLLAAVLRLVGLGSASLWYDEGASLYLGNYVTTPSALFDPSRNIEPPVNAIMTGVWSSLISALSPTKVTDGAHDFLLRLLPWFFGVLNCVLVYRVTLVLYRSTPTALCAAFLFAIAPFQIYYAQELRVYGLYVTLSLLAVWSMTAALSENRHHHWASYVASLTLLMYSHFFSMWLIFTLNVAFVALLWKYKRVGLRPMRY
jgi:mannosyltransferase